MKIWLINHYNMPPELGTHTRHYNIGKYLKLLGHEPKIFVGSYLHNTNIQMIEDESLVKKYEKASFDYFFVKTCNYTKSKIKRLYSMYEFYKNVLKATKSFEKPDVVLGSSAHPLAALAAIKLAKRYKCQSIVEVRDLWPESFVAYGVISKKNPLLKLLYAGEKWIYNRADKLIFTMEGGKDYITDHKWDLENGGTININKIFHVNNGVDLEVFNDDKENNHIEDSDLDNKDTFKVIYTGSIRLVNNVKSIVDVAKAIKNQSNENIKFLIFGDGNNKEQLEQYCLDHNIDNIVFKGVVEKKYIPYILSKSDLNIVHFKQSKLQKYGGSLNKLFEYFASKKPTVSDCEFGYDLIKKYKCGIIINDPTPNELATGILKIYNMEQNEYDKMCDNAYKAAKDYDFAVLVNKLITIVEKPYC